MSELTLLLLRVGFLLLLWFFIFAIVYALRSDLFGAPVRRLKNSDGQAGPVVQAAPVMAQQAATPAPAPAAPQTPSGGAARQLFITSGVAAGTSIVLDEDFVTIGRSGDSTLVIVDEYTSTYHARLSKNGETWILTDLDSTNGTRLSGQRITHPVPVPLFTPVTIGTTTFELRP